LRVEIAACRYGVGVNGREALMTAVRRHTIAGNDAVLELIPTRHGDERGFFSEVYSKLELAKLGFDLDFVQDNQSLSRASGTVRGLHFQAAPFAQSKLVRVLRGAILDVAVDIRLGSPTYGQHVSVVISAKDWNQLLVPKGFAHGFCTIEPDTEIFYKVDAPYAPDHEHGIYWADPDLGIRWPVSPDQATVSERDRKLPRLKDLRPFFRFDAGRLGNTG
jgi:dTDP-4-dehydrorhamnose 3,5-epimerase